MVLAPQHLIKPPTPLKYFSLPHLVEEPFSFLSSYFGYLTSTSGMKIKHPVYIMKWAAICKSYAKAGIEV